LFLIDGWLPKCAIVIPFIGYLILFNDYVTDHLTFKNIVDDNIPFKNFTAKDRLAFVYFGLIFVGISNLIYRLRKPWIHKVGKSEFDFVETGLKYFTFDQYLTFHNEIQNCHYTRHGKYYTYEWDEFCDVAASNYSDGVPKVGNFSKAKTLHDGLLRSILIETFFRNDIKNRRSLIFALLIAIVGYILLAIPSGILFIQILISVFS
tara:strand:+ start:268 stop:885 length:618 start_codon:yes stop_codon:yes gene_type:complete